MTRTRGSVRHAPEMARLGGRPCVESVAPGAPSVVRWLVLRGAEAFTRTPVSRDRRAPAWWSFRFGAGYVREGWPVDLRRLLRPSGEAAPRARCADRQIGALEASVILCYWKKRLARRSAVGPCGPRRAMLSSRLAELPFGVVLSVEVPIWLILPVVIRSSQRLSHACLSISDLVL